ncbi:MAG: hypothetical protein KF823_10980 [Xanthomonadales bacterium]|nr:hypothetical protein [Xanthomonadales bacterium]
MNRLTTLSALLTATFLALPLFASNLKVLTEDDLSADSFPAAAQELRANLAGSTGHGLSSGQRERVLQSLARIEGWLAEDASGNQPRIHAEQRRINALIAPQVASRGNERSNLVCKRVRPIGSNIPVTECKTREQLAAEQEAARDALSDEQRRRSM